MSAKPSVQKVQQADASVLRPQGDWTLEDLAAARDVLDAVWPTGAPPQIELDGIQRLDSSGAWLLIRRFDEAMEADAVLQFLQGGRKDHQHLLRTVLRARVRVDNDEPPPEPSILERTGRAVFGVIDETRDLLGFLGLTLSRFGSSLLQPQRLRITAIVSHMERSGVDALPIVALLSFLIGAVIAYLGASVLKPYGGEVFTVELIAFSFMREFGPLLTAIILAGRSGSSFTAEIGSMKGREELDAMRTLGLDPIELLVLPRALALCLTLPMLSFLATVLGIIGGAVVAVNTLDITPGLFLARMQESMDWRHLVAGLIKTPFFAAAIALIGCLEGMKVAGSAESVGRHTTSAVVQSIFVVILLDAAFAMFFLEIDF